MSVDKIPTLTDLVRPSTRREFLLKSSTLGVLAPFALSAQTFLGQTLGCGEVRGCRRVKLQTSQA